MGFPLIEIFSTFLIGFVLGCLAADAALKKKTGVGIQIHLMEHDLNPKAPLKDLLG